MFSSSSERFPMAAAWRCRAVLLLLPLMLSACYGFRDVGRSLEVAGAEAQVSELRHASVCNSPSGAAAVTILNDAPALRAWQQIRGVDLIGDAPLAPGPYALVEHGARNTGGYAVVVSRRAAVSAGVLTLRASFFAPTGDALHPEMLTSPCALVELPAGNYDLVQLLDTQGRRRAISNAPPLAAPAASTPAQ